MADPTNSAGFFDEVEAEELAKLRKAWIKSEREALAISAAPQTRPEASVSIQRQAGSPTYHGYQVAIPAGWKALLPVFYPIPDAPDEPARQGMPAALLKGWQRFRVGVLLCRQGTDGQEALQEFADGVLLEAAFLSQDGLYLRAAPERPAYAVIPLAAPSSKTPSPLPCAECLILVPSIDPRPSGPRAALPPIMMFVGGVRVYSSIEGEAL